VRLSFLVLNVFAFVFFCDLLVWISYFSAKASIKAKFGNIEDQILVIQYIP
jgi:hypothetical protein